MDEMGHLAAVLTTSTTSSKAIIQSGAVRDRRVGKILRIRPMRCGASGARGREKAAQATEDDAAYGGLHLPCALDRSARTGGPHPDEAKVLTGR
jgi:hypothetical protein